MSMSYTKLLIYISFKNLKKIFNIIHFGTIYVCSEILNTHVSVFGFLRKKRMHPLNLNPFAEINFSLDFENH